MVDFFPSPFLFHLIGKILIETLISAQRRRLHLLYGVQARDSLKRNIDKLRLSEEGGNDDGLS